MSGPPLVAQIKLHRYFGGGEVYAQFITRSLSNLTIPNIIFTHKNADYWELLTLPNNSRQIKVSSLEEIIHKIPKGILIITHAPLEKKYSSLIQKNNPMISIVHMPFTGNRSDFDGYKMIIGVSEHVNNSLIAKGIKPWHTPLLGIGEISRIDNITSTEIIKRSEYDWDQRKFRDRFLGWTEKYWSHFRLSHTFHPVDQCTTIAIVSRLAPIKKFPELFMYLSPIISVFPKVRIEIFGSGGFAQVRDIKKALKPISNRVRFWGHQNDIRSVYKNVDYVLSGLPEREALGLNLIEAQQLGTPVIAVDSPPFTETVSHGVTGWLYKDPRKDGGADFMKLLTGIVNRKMILNECQRESHLNKFSIQAFTERLNIALKPFIQQ